MIPVTKQYFDKIFPELERIYNHSHKFVKLWDNTVHKKLIVSDVESKIKQYWKNGYIIP